MAPDGTPQRMAPLAASVADAGADPGTVPVRAVLPQGGRLRVLPSGGADPGLTSTASDAAPPAASEGRLVGAVGTEARADGHTDAQARGAGAGPETSPTIAAASGEPIPSGPTTPDTTPQRRSESEAPGKHSDAVAPPSGGSVHSGATVPDRAAPATASPTPMADSLSAALRALAEKIAAQADQPDRHGVELTLAPEELGRIRLTMDGGDGRMTVTVQADRAETLDLLRRNIDMLAQDFRDLGYAQTSFSFGGGASESPPQPSAPPPARAAPAEVAFTPAFHQPTLVGPVEGLDLRV